MVFYIILGSILAFLVFTLYTVLVATLKLKITKDAIVYQFIPWQKRAKIINKTDIKHLEIVKSNIPRIGPSIQATNHYVIVTGYSLYIRDSNSDYLLSTGLEKDEVLQVLNKYGYEVF
ncbi:MAG: hypothetical protein ACQPRJ_05340 [Solitalea-like symbiont of Acarus siro]